MPRSFTAGNGDMLVGVDDSGRLQDLYYPHVGLENHIGEGRSHRVGVFVDGQMAWLEDEEFSVEVEPCDDTLVAEITAKHERLGVKLSIRDVLYNEKPIYVREVEVKNLWDVEREIIVFAGQEFQISQSREASTAYYDPEAACLFHYRGRRVFAIGAAEGGENFDEYTTGVTGIEGKAGSWRDAEDGDLQENPIEHGPADSCLGVTRTYKAKSSRKIYYWIAAGKSIAEAKRRHTYVHSRSPEHLLQTTKDFWHAWLQRRPVDFADLPRSVVDLFNRSLLVMRSHADKDGGIIASSDSDMLQWGKDSYTYAWPRDGSYIASALDDVGVYNTSQRFFTFLANGLTDDGYMMHKYGPDGSLGSSWHPWLYDGEYQLPIQEDETAIALFSLWRHYEASRDLEFIEDLYNRFINKAADFLLQYRHDEIGLPYASYDLWEERVGIHTYTASAVYGGLQAAANFADLLGKKTSATCWRAAADEIKAAILKYLYNDEAGYFARSGRIEDETFVVDSTVDFSSAFGVYHFGVLPESDPRLVSAMNKAVEQLHISDVGGFARYQGDRYYRNERTKNAAVPGNPWIITTLWYAQFLIARADIRDDLAEAADILTWVEEQTTPAGMLPEQLDLETGERLSATPLVWSHGEFVRTTKQYLDRWEELS